MLLSLAVKNFILLDELHVGIKDGLTVITGETGAGKSILLDALLFCLGGKFQTNVIKSGQEAASVTASFSISNNTKDFLEQAGIEIETEEITVKRIINISAKKKLFINDQIVTQRTVEELADHLIEVHAQNSLTNLSDAKTHLNLLDSFAENEILRVNLNKKVKRWQEIKREIKDIQQEQLSNENEIDYLGHAIEEIKKINVRVGEEKELIEIKTKLLKQDKEAKTLEEILSSLELEQIDHALSKALKIINRLSADDEELIQTSQLIEQTYSNIDQARVIVKNKLRNVEAKEYDLEEIEERLYSIKSLARKYRVDSDEIENFVSSNQEKLLYLKSKVANAANLELELAKTQDEYTNLARQITERRKAAIVVLEDKIQNELAVLKMDKAIFKVSIAGKEKNEPAINGNDIVNFVASTNPGTPLASIDKIASGGELSRIMLALKVALFDRGEKNTLIFDEIDTGIGGAVADSVGEKLKYLGKICQVIVITHQPQVASKADNHILVTKQQETDRTTLEVRLLDAKERQQELARMLSGKAITESSLKAASDLLN